MWRKWIPVILFSIAFFCFCAIMIHDVAQEDTKMRMEREHLLNSVAELIELQYGLAVNQSLIVQQLNGINQNLANLGVFPCEKCE
jgi:hypothetical protein